MTIAELFKYKLHKQITSEGVVTTYELFKFSGK